MPHHTLFYVSCITATASNRQLHEPVMQNCCFLIKTNQVYKLICSSCFCCRNCKKMSDQTSKCLLWQKDVWCHLSWTNQNLGFMFVISLMKCPFRRTTWYKLAVITIPPLGSNRSLKMTEHERKRIRLYSKFNLTFQNVISFISSLSELMDRWTDRLTYEK